MKHITSTKVTDHPRYENNPFLEELTQQLDIRAVKSKGRNKGVSEYIPYGTTQHEEYIRISDREGFVKLYAQDIRKMFSLTKTAQTVLGEMMMQLAADKNSGNKLRIPAASWWKENLRLSPSAFWVAIGDLLAKQFIARSEIDNVFYFNPLMVFNGNRASFIKTYVLDEIEAKKDKKHEEATEPTNENDNNLELAA